MMAGFDNENLFDAAGHLTGEGLLALVDGRLDELGALEAAEHLSYCDACLTRYTALLEGAPLETPQKDVAPAVQRGLYVRGARIYLRRYFTAAAAVILAFGLWKIGVFGTGLRPRPIRQPQRSAFSLSESIGTFFNDAQSTLNAAFGSMQASLQSGFAQLSDPDINKE